MSQALQENFPIKVSFLGDYPDFLSFAVIILLSCFLAFGVKESSVLNNIFTVLNLGTVCIVLVAGAIKADPANWALKDVPENAGSGGFMPYGLSGVMAGAAKCFYGFVGFDVVATTGEEAKNPKRNIPLAIVISLIIIFMAYFGVSTVLTMMWPYYLQDPNAPFPHVFEEVGWISIKWVVTIGAVFALFTSLLGSVFPLPRILYAMGNDGIIFKFFANVNSYTKTPLLGTAISGTLAAVMALIFDLQQLIEMMSIGTFLAYSIVAICVLVLRYHHDDATIRDLKEKPSTLPRQLFNMDNIKNSSPLTANITKGGIVLFSLVAICICIVLQTANLGSFSSTVVLVVLIVILLLIVYSIHCQPVPSVDLTFKVPFVPFIPCLSVFVNLYLMFQLDIYTWIRFLIWLVIGYCIYFTYGIRNSTQISRDKAISANVTLSPSKSQNGGFDNAAFTTTDEKPLTYSEVVQNEQSQVKG